MSFPIKKIMSCLYKIKLYQGTMLIVGGGLWSVASHAEQTQKPLFMPTVDATVTYAVQPDNSPLLQKRKIYFSKDGSTFRIDGPNNIGMTIVDSNKETAIVTANKPKVYTVIHSKSGKTGLFLDDKMQFVKKGTERIAGVLCRKWSVKGAVGNSTVCVTDDGILLSQEGVDADGVEGKTIALSVDKAPLLPAVFQVPVGFQQVKLPERKGDTPVLVSPNHNAQPLLSISAKPLNQVTDKYVNQEQNPFVTPQTDVDVFYAIAGPMPGLPPFHQQMRWSVDEAKQRIDSQGIDTYMITDYKQKQLIVLNPELKKKTTMPMPGFVSVALNKRAEGDYLKVGEATVAGESCTEWQMTDTEGNPNDICYTNDGIMLRVVRNNIPLVVALKVMRGHQDHSLFAISSDLKELAPAHP